SILHDLVAISATVHATGKHSTEFAIAGSSQDT
ncbi:hypothetical protein A2U01_0010609, partial [Trifolium medium]|nr:hypothetical protein [Trifolium medium]